MEIFLPLHELIVISMIRVHISWKTLKTNADLSHGQEKWSTRYSWCFKWFKLIWRLKTFLEMGTLEYQLLQSSGMKYIQHFQADAFLVCRVLKPQWVWLIRFFLQDMPLRNTSKWLLQILWHLYNLKIYDIIHCYQNKTLLPQ